MKIHPLITTTLALTELCERLAKAPFVTVDTEFMRENTFWPELCLIQIADETEAAAIDPLAKGIDMAPLWDLMVNNEDVLKVFHAGGQDVEIIFNLTGKTPHPIFDTQIAMMAVSQAEQIGYSNLVESWLGIPVDKGARFTDWSRRPLTERQIEYAIGDVTHVEMERLADPENYRSDVDKAWLRIKAPSRNPAVLGRLKAIAAWREREAMDKNIPRGRMMRDETIADIAGHPPKDQSELAQVRGLSTGWKDNDIGRRLMGVLANARPMTEEEMPPRAPRGAPLGKEGALVADLLKLLLKIRAREIDIAARLLARSDDLEALAAGQRKGVAILEGWRMDVFGRDALDLVEGRLAFAVVKGKLKMAHIDDIGAKDEAIAHIDEAPAAAIEDDDDPLVIAEPNIAANDED
jgi:ribonuclease D